MLSKKIIFTSIIIGTMLFATFPKADQQSQLNNIQKKIREYQSEQSQINNQKNDVSNQLQDLNKKINDNQAQINDAERKLYDLNMKLNSVQKDLSKAKEDEYKQKDLLKKQLRAIYISGPTGYLDILFNSKNIDEFLSNFELVKRLLSFDNNLLKNYQNQILKVNQEEKQLIAVKQTIKNEEALIQQRNRDLQYAFVSRQGVMRNLNERSQYIQEQQKELQRESQQIENIIKSELAKQQSTPTVTKPITGIVSNTGGKLGWPCNGPITSPFGNRGNNPYTGSANDFHPGIDIAVPDGTPIHAAANGVVTYSGVMEGYGNVVIINNGNGISTLYAHNERLIVSAGEQVTRGQVIAYSGHTGWATGPHCHFGVYLNGAPVNPMSYL